MSSEPQSSESEDEEMAAELLEAIDKDFFTDGLFNSKLRNEQNHNNQLCHKEITSENILPGTRSCYSETNPAFDGDTCVSEEVQKYFAKQLTKIIETETEFFQGQNTAYSEEIHKGQLKLLRGADCHVKSYEDVDYNMPKLSKPKIKRRKLADEPDLTRKEKIKVAAICHQHILDLSEMKTWDIKPKRIDRFYSYTANGKTLIATSK